jgi:hypothetical protein
LRRVEDALTAHLLEDWRKAHDIWSSVRNALAGSTVIDGSSVDKVDGMHAADFIARKRPVEVKTDSYLITAANFGKILVMDAAAEKTFTLPSVGSLDVGEELTLVKWGTGKLTIQAADSDIFRSPDMSSVAGGQLYNAVDQYSRVQIRLITATEWLLEGWTGTGWLMTT